MWVPWSCCASSCVVFLACTSAVPSRRRSRRPRRVEAPEAPMLLRTRHSCELCLFQYMSSSFLSTSVDSRLALPVSTDTKSVRDKLVYLQILVVFVPCAAAAGHAVTAVPSTAAACWPWLCMSWPASVRLALRLPAAAAGSAALADRGWVRCGPVPAGAWLASWLAPAALRQVGVWCPWPAMQQASVIAAAGDIGGRGR